VNYSVCRGCEERRDEILRQVTTGRLLALVAERRAMRLYIHRLGAAVTEYVAAARVRLAREEGQALVEYALILFLVALVCIGVLTLLGSKVSSVISSVVNDF
jgi:pilus assembly protein Flp/PilA